MADADRQRIAKLIEDLRAAGADVRKAPKPKGAVTQSSIEALVQDLQNGAKKLDVWVSWTKSF